MKVKLLKKLRKKYCIVKQPANKVIFNSTNLSPLYEEQYKTKTVIGINIWGDPQWVWSDWLPLNKAISEQRNSIIKHIHFKK